MHVYFDYRSKLYKKINRETEQMLNAKTSDIDAQQRLIDDRKTLIMELNLEYQQTQDAAIQFGFFLKRHAITPYNDATLEYVDHQIDEEQKKIKAGGTRQKLDKLQEYRQEHQEKVAAVEKAMSAGKAVDLLDDDGIKRLIDSLYQMQHYGNLLHDVIKKNEEGRQRIYREKSYNIQTGSHWAGGMNSQIDDSWENVGHTGTIPGSFPGSFPMSFPGAHPGVKSKSNAPKRQATKAPGSRSGRSNQQPVEPQSKGVAQNFPIIRKVADFIGFKGLDY